LQNRSVVVQGIRTRVSSFFERASDNRCARIVLLLFLASALITFVKTFFKTERTRNITFFNDSVLNAFFMFLSTPLVLWAVTLVGYFIFILSIFGLCKLLNGHANGKALLLSLMSLSGIGVVVQLACFVVRLISSHNLAVVLLGFTAYVLVIVASLWAITSTQKMSFAKTLACFFIPYFPIVVLLGLPGISPYLLWLAV